MQKTFEKQEQIRSGMMDSLMRLTVPHALELCQDITSDHSEIMGVSNRQVREDSNAFWVITRMKIRFAEPLRFFDKVMVKTWPLPPGGIACGRNYQIWKNGALAVEAKSEWMLLDIGTHEIRRVDTTCYPVEAEHETDKGFAEPYRRFREKFGEEDLVHEHIVRATDIDMSHHTNNIRYVRFLLDSFPLAELEAHDVTDFEIRYGKESREGDRLLIYRKAAENGHWMEIRSEKGETVASAWIGMSPREQGM